MKWKISEVVQGVRPDPIERFVYHVQSRSRPWKEHRVDMTAFDGWGACGCERFEFKCRGPLLRGEKPREALQCRHLKDCRPYVQIWFVRATLSIMHAQAPARYGHGQATCAVDADTRGSGVVAGGAGAQGTGTGRAGGGAAVAVGTEHKAFGGCEPAGNGELPGRMEGQDPDALRW